jgi:transposase
MMTQKNRYPSDVTNTQWLFIQRVLKAEEQAGVTHSARGRPRAVEIRSVINAINYRWKTGCTWRMLPHDFPKWETVYTYFRYWRNQGLLPKLREVMILKKYPAKKELLENAERLRFNKHDNEEAGKDDFGTFVHTEPLLTGSQIKELEWPTCDMPREREKSNGHECVYGLDVAKGIDQLDPKMCKPDGLQRSMEALR